MELQLFNYNGNNVSFKKEGEDVFVNATEMAKQFSKRPVDYLKLTSTTDLIDAYVRKNHTSENQLVKTVMGSSDNGGGTWLHEDLAIDFAQWLSVDFRLWVADRIKQLLKTGVTTITDDDDVIAQAMNVLQKRLDAKSKQLEIANKTITEQAPLVQLAEECYSSETTILTTIIATRLEFSSAQSLNNKLKSLGIQYKIDGCWKLYSKYEGKGYTRTFPVPYKKKDGTQGTQNQMEWTERGFVFLKEFLTQNILA